MTQINRPTLLQPPVVAVRQTLSPADTTRHTLAGKRAAPDPGQLPSLPDPAGCDGLCRRMSMTRNVCIIQGHPHGAARHLCHELADAYGDGAKAAGAKVSWIDLGCLDIPLLRNPADFMTRPDAAIVAAQNTIKACDHLVIVYPIWLGNVPAVVKAFFEQLFRENFAITTGGMKQWPKQMLKGKSARLIVTMGMPAMAYRLAYGAHGVRAFKSSILRMAGIKPIRETMIGGVGQLKDKQVTALRDRMRRLGGRLA
ncbi:MAG: NAD(P)H-dependent oxidoreductase [Alphaproteobacteria bacterium]